MFPSNACAVSILSNTVVGFKVMDYIPDVSQDWLLPFQPPRLYRHHRLRIPRCQRAHVGEDQVPRAIAAELFLVLPAHYRERA